MKLTHEGSAGTDSVCTLIYGVGEQKRSRHWMRKLENFNAVMIRV
jgi:hypothetical protein